jgi:hypothetical protein
MATALQAEKIWSTMGKTHASGESRMAKAKKGINPGKRSKDLNMAVREVCFGLPEVTEVESHGSPDFRVDGKTFATLAINHHGDGRIALWLPMPAGSQPYYVENEPEHYFVPPYVGPRGWLGVHLDQGLSWKAIAQRVREAWDHVAPRSLQAQAGELRLIEPPTRTLDPMDFDPLTVPVHAKRLEGLRERALAYPESTEDRRFGDPIWRAGKKTFATAYASKKQIFYGFWVGLDAQPQFQMDDRFHIPAYTGHNGWISMDVTRGCRWGDVAPLLDASYRHFALKRMIKALDEGG